MLRNVLIVLKGIILFPLTMLYLVSSKNTKILIKADASQFKKSKVMNYLKYITSPYTRRIFYHRIGKVSYLISFVFPGEKTFSIANDCVIGGGMVTHHSFATVINANSIGENFTVMQCTTLGSKKVGDRVLKPTLGNNVFCGANVNIIGGVKIGNNVTIGAGTVIVKDIEDNAIVVGNPAKIIGYNN